MMPSIAAPNPPAASAACSSVAARYVESISRNRQPAIATSAAHSAQAIPSAEVSA